MSENNDVWRLSVWDSNNTVTHILGDFSTMRGYQQEWKEALESEESSVAGVAKKYMEIEGYTDTGDRGVVMLVIRFGSIINMCLFKWFPKR